MAGSTLGATVERARGGDREAYEELAREAAQRLYPVAMRMLRERDLADEAVQRTLVAIWRSLPGLRDVSRFEAWSYRLLVRFCGDELRRRQRVLLNAEVLDWLPGADDEVSRMGDRDELARAFACLSADHRAVVVLTYYRGLSGPEVARALGISAGTVASRLHYALRHMRAALEAGRRLQAPVPGRQPVAA